MSHHGRAPKERAVSPVRHLSMRHEPITASAAPRAREASSRAASPPQRQRAPPRLRRASHAALASSWRPQLARRTTAARRRRESLSPVAAPFASVDTQPMTATAAPRARGASSSAAPPSPETASADAPVPRDTRGAGLKFEVAAVMSHHGRAPKERAVSPVRHLSTRREPITASAAPRAHEASSSAASPPQRQRAPPRLCRASHAALASSLRPQLAHRTTVLRRKERSISLSQRHLIG